MEVVLIYNVVLFSGIQQSHSVIHICKAPIFKFFLYLYPLPYNIEVFSTRSNVVSILIIYMLCFGLSICLHLFVTPKSLLISLSRSFTDMPGVAKILSSQLRWSKSVLCHLVWSLVLEIYPLCSLFNAIYICSFVLFVDDFTVQNGPKYCAHVLFCVPTYRKTVTCLVEKIQILGKFFQAWVIVLLALGSVLMNQ